MTLEEKKKQYQQMLVQEYRSSNPEETENLTDEEVALMNPITDYEFTFLIGNELNSINREIVELMEDIKHCEDRMNTLGIHYQEVTDCRSDIVYDERRLAELRQQFDTLKKVLLERKAEDERSR